MCKQQYKFRYSGYHILILEIGLSKVEVWYNMPLLSKGLFLSSHINFCYASVTSLAIFLTMVITNKVNTTDRLAPLP
jgi:hypothetical protein